ncbi:MAG: uncharacterized protein PWQ16_138 [bacterium]|nr:MAG: Uncharacterized protein XD52_0885 [bacterium 42_11]MDK2870786.1 uncharacterized protein [bacterium]
MYFIVFTLFIGILWFFDGKRQPISVKGGVSSNFKRIVLSLDSIKMTPKAFNYSLSAGLGKGASLAFLSFIKREREKRSLPKLALIIDDFGYDSGIANKFISLPYKLTLSVLPFLKWSSFVSEKAHLHGKEVLLHLPMQAYGHSVGPNVISIGMSLREIRSIVDRSLSSVSHAVGVNNHMGSMATANRVLMKKVMKVLSERGLFFIDSYTTPDTVAYHVALEMGLPCFYNSLFIDNYSVEDKVEEYLLRLLHMAKKRRLTIGIGHARVGTLNVLEKLLPVISKQVEVVFASEIVYHRGEVFKDERYSHSRYAMGR